MMPQTTDRILWQHPYVNVFKQFKVDNWKRASKEGDVSSVMDKHLKCTVYRILGSVPAGNYIQLPSTSTQSLGLTGRYVYFLFKPWPSRHFVIHIDTATDEGMVVRISFSNLFKEFKSTSTWLQFPFACQAAKGSVEYEAAQGARTDIISAAPTAQRWTMIVLDLNYILSMYINRKYSHIKSFKLCSNMLVKNIFTSDIEYDPRLTFRKARELGIKTVDENLAPMPREMNFFAHKNKSWDDSYDLIRFPTYPKSEAPAVAPFDSIQPSTVKQHSKVTKRGVGRTTRGPPGVVSPRRQQGATVDTGRNVGLYTSAQHTVTVATSAKQQPKHKPMNVVPELPHVGLNLLSSTQRDDSTTLHETEAGDVHVFADTLHKRDVVVHRHFAHAQNHTESIASVKPLEKEAIVTSPEGKKRAARNQKSKKEAQRTLKPDPILKLRQIIGFASPSIFPNAYRHQALWFPDSGVAGGNEMVVYATHAIVVTMHIATNKQYFFIGHTAPVSAIAFNNCTRKHENDLSSPIVLASAQGGANAVVRVWKFDTRKCLCIVKCQRTNRINALAFSMSGAVLVASGRDTNGKTMLIVWDTSAVLHHTGSVRVIARACVDVTVMNLCVAPTDDTRIVTSCHDNIRFWRVRSGQLRSCPVNLSDHKIGDVTNITFSKSDAVSDQNNSAVLPSVHVDGKTRYSVYACTRSGYVIEVDFQTVQVKSMHQIFATSQKDTDTKGISLNTIRFTNNYLATGSDDGYLRLWPLDLSTVFLEAKHEGPVTDINITSDGMKVLAATSAATLGYLDVSTRKYTTLMRSHTDKMSDACVDQLRDNVTTCSDDGSIRVWDNTTRRQLYDFATSEDIPTAITCHQRKQIFACGFSDGHVRVFHVSESCLLAEHQLHQALVSGLAFLPNGKALVSNGEKGTVVLYDTSDVERSGAPVIRNLPRLSARGPQYHPRSVAVSDDSRRVAFVGPTEYTVTVASSATLDELLRVDVSTGLHLQPDILNKKPSVDIPLHVSFSSGQTGHLLVATAGGRLLKLDVNDGKLIATCENMHRKKMTAMCTSGNGKYLVSAGDNLVKVWDYSMKRDINFQIFIGHCSPINRIAFSADQRTLITCGQDAILYWDFCGTVAQPAVKDVMVTESELQLIPTRDSGPGVASPSLTPQPRKTLPTPMMKREMQQQETLPPETLHTADLDASDVPEFTVDGQMISHIANNKQNRKESEEQAPDPIKVTWGKNTARSAIEANNPRKEVVSIDPAPQITAISERPNCIKHFHAHDTASNLPEEIYAPREDSKCLKLQAAIGYNGNGRGNMVWSAETGVFAYSIGCLVILEDLSSGNKTLLRRHTQEVSTMTLQHDSLIMASASVSHGQTDSMICLWDVQTFECRAELKHHQHDIVALAYSRDDRFLVSIGNFRDNSVVVWSGYDGVTKPVVLAMSKLQHPIHHITWDTSSPNEFVTVGSEASVCFWMLQEVGQEVVLQIDQVKVPEEVSRGNSNNKAIMTSCCYGDRNLLYVGSNTGVVSVWSTQTNECFMHWRADTGEICSLVARGSRLSVAGATLRKWYLVDPTSDECTFTLEDELAVQSHITHSMFDDEMDMGIVATSGGSLLYVDWNNRSTVQIVTGHHKKITSLCFDNRCHFASGSNEGTVRLWSEQNMELIVQFQVFNESCLCVAFSNGQMDGRYMLVAGYSGGHLRVFDVDKIELMLKLQPHAVSVTTVAFSTDNSILLSGGRDGRVAASSVATGVTLRVFDDHKGSPIAAIQVSTRKDHPCSLTTSSTTGEVWLVTSCDRRVSVWVSQWHRDTCTMVDWLTFPAPCFAPDGQPIQRNGKVQLPVSACKFHPTDPDLLVYVGYGMTKQIQIYSLAKKKVVKCMKMPNWSRCMDVCSLDKSKKGLIAIGTDSRIVQVYDLHHGTFQDYTGHCDVVQTVTFNCDATKLFTTSHNEILVWDVSV